MNTTHCCVCGILKVRNKNPSGRRENNINFANRKTCMDEGCMDENKMRTREKTRAANAKWFHVKPCVFEKFYLNGFAQ